VSWVVIPNGKKQDGIMSINTDHIIRYFDLGLKEFDGDPEPRPYVSVQLSNGDKPILQMTARQFYSLLHGSEYLTESQLYTEP
jgi:hypothetical protein